MATTIATLMGSRWGIWGRAGVSLCQNVRHLVIIVVAFLSYEVLKGMMDMKGRLLDCLII